MKEQPTNFVINPSNNAGETRAPTVPYGLDGSRERLGKMSIEDVKRQLIENFTYIILSRLASPVGLKVGLKDFQNKPVTLLLDTLGHISRAHTLNQIILPADQKRPLKMEEAEGFFAESFAQKLEELWNKNPEPTTTERDREIIKICGQLKAKNPVFQDIVSAVCNHFHIATIPEKYKYQPKTASSKK